MLDMSPMDMRDTFLARLYDAARIDPRIMILSDDFGAPMLDRYRQDLPDQFINAGISEQNIIGVAAGLAASGFRPVVYSIATFTTLRCFEQIKIDLCVMNLPVTILAVGTGYAYSGDGPTHHATEDIAVMRTLANLSIYSPCEPAQCIHLAATVGTTAGPRYIRLDRGKWPILGLNDNDMETGLRVFGDGRDCAIITTGNMVHRALETKEYLAKENIDVKVIDLYRLKPVDSKALLEALGGVSCIVTLEEQSIHGGLGGIVSEFLIDTGHPARAARCAIADDLLYAYGARDRLQVERKLDMSGVGAKVKQLMACKN